MFNKKDSLISLFFRNDILTYAFGTTTCMWMAGYFTHIPNLTLPSYVVFFLLLIAMILSGLLIGLRTAEGWKAGACVGFIVSLLNMMILGSLITGDQPNQVVPSAALFVPGSMVFTTVLLAVFAGIASLLRSSTASSSSDMGLSPFAWVASGTTLFLILAGGLVTSKDAGLAVVDWPNSEGYAMFLYPLSRMTGGVYYEHAHRLIGSLVGLTTLVFMVLVYVRDSRTWLKLLATGVFILCCIQGIMGGLRVTGSFTLSTNPEDMAPSIIFAVIHGVTGQVFLTLLIALAVFTSRKWVSDTPPEEVASASTDRLLMPLLYACLITQLVIGAILRHTQAALMIHISMGAIVFALALYCGVRMWGLYPSINKINILGVHLAFAVVIQFILGVFALYGVMHNDDPAVFTLAEIIYPTLHQAFGACLLGITTMLMLWAWRLLKPLPNQARSV